MEINEYLLLKFLAMLKHILSVLHNFLYVIAGFMLGIIMTSVFAAWDSIKGPGSPILSADWNALVAAVNSKLSSYTETDPKVGTHTSNYISKWNGTVFQDTSLSESGNTKLVVKGSSTDNQAFGLNVTDSADASKLLVRNDGNVGIGTSTPTAKLDVNGVINVNNNVISNLAAPITTTDAANKAYVDAAAGGTSLLCAFTTSSYTGNLGGINGANTKCVSEFGAGWKFGAAWQIANTFHTTVFIDNGGWILPTGNGGNCGSWFDGSSGSYGNVLESYAGGGYFASWRVSSSNGYCYQNKPIVCCNF